ncbi:hypothetical protein Tco_0886751 [Tanacetum coccineum]
MLWRGNEVRKDCCGVGVLAGNGVGRDIQSMGVVVGVMRVGGGLGWGGYCGGGEEDVWARLGSVGWGVWGWFEGATWVGWCGVDGVRVVLWWGVGGLGLCGGAWGGRSGLGWWRGLVGFAWVKWGGGWVGSVMRGCSMYMVGGWGGGGCRAVVAGEVGGVFRCGGCELRWEGWEFGGMYPLVGVEGGALLWGRVGVRVLWGDVGVCVGWLELVMSGDVQRDKKGTGCGVGVLAGNGVGRDIQYPGLKVIKGLSFEFKGKAELALVVYL